MSQIRGSISVTYHKETMHLYSYFYITTYMITLEYTSKATKQVKKLNVSKFYKNETKKMNSVAFFSNCMRIIGDS